MLDEKLNKSAINVNFERLESRKIFMFMESYLIAHVRLCPQLSTSRVAALVAAPPSGPGTRRGTPIARGRGRWRRFGSRGRSRTRGTSVAVRT